MKTGFSFEASRRRPRGFTLVQIVVATAILGVLAAVLMSVVAKGRTGANRLACDTHLKGIALALDAFKQEHGHFPPDLGTLQTDKYITDASVLSCPADPRERPSYADYYAIRGPRDKNELPILICPFHEEQRNGLQAFVGRYTTQRKTAPARLTAAMGTTVQHPGKNPVAAPVGLALRGADRLRTSGDGSATITFADGSQAEIGRNSDLTVLQSFIEGQTEGALYTLLHQSLGTVNYQVHHGSKFDVVTPTATAGALGTRFEVRVSVTEGTWLRVSQGRVRFNTLAGSLTTTSTTTSAITSEDGWIAAPPPESDPVPGSGRGPGPRPGRGLGPPPPP